MRPNVTTSVELKQSQLDWLGEMAKKYDLPDSSKALRCLIEFALDHPESDDIFEEIRCSGC